MDNFVLTGSPTIVKTDMNIRSMGPISEVDMVTISCVLLTKKEIGSRFGLNLTV